MLVECCICDVHSLQKSIHFYSEEGGHVRGKMPVGLELGMNEIRNNCFVAHSVCLTFNGPSWWVMYVCTVCVCVLQR